MSARTASMDISWLRQPFGALQHPIRMAVLRVPIALVKPPVIWLVASATSQSSTPVAAASLLDPLSPTQDDNFNNTAGLYDIWLQQIKTSWREVPNNTSAASRLTPELKDLLDKMFDVKQVRAHAASASRTKAQLVLMLGNVPDPGCFPT